MLNKCILIGRLGKDPEVRFTPDGKQTTSFSLATDESYKNKSGEKVSKTEWHRIVTWEKLAEICSTYLTKGSLIYIEGKLQTRKWTDKEGKDNYTTEILGRQMTMLSGKKEEEPPPADFNPDDVPF
jgi:single-strand DNA-binding protein